MANLHVVFPAYHPLFVVICRDCLKETNSPGALADLDKKGDYVCDRCAFTFYHVNAKPEFEARDLKEVKQYGSLYGVKT